VLRKIKLSKYLGYLFFHGHNGIVLHPLSPFPIIAALAASCRGARGPPTSAEPNAFLQYRGLCPTYFIVYTSTRGNRNGFT
jgi:hypothetical protein